MVMRKGSSIVADAGGPDGQRGGIPGWVTAKGLRRRSGSRSRTAGLGCASPRVSAASLRSPILVGWAESSWLKRSCSCGATGAMLDRRNETGNSDRLIGDPSNFRDGLLPATPNMALLVEPVALSIARRHAGVMQRHDIPLVIEDRARRSLLGVAFIMKERAKSIGGGIVRCS